MPEPPFNYIARLRQNSFLLAQNPLLVFAYIGEAARGLLLPWGKHKKIRTDFQKESGPKKRNKQMKRFARMLFVGLGFVIAGSAMSLTPHRVATAGGMSAVTVTNPSLAVTQSGPWNVGINGTPNVNIGTPTVNLGVGSTVGISGMPTVTIGGSSVALPTQDLSAFASANVSLQNRVPNTGVLGLIDLSSTGVSASCCFSVPAGQTLVVTSIDISPVTPGSGTNHIFLAGSLNGAAEAFFRSFVVSNATSTHLDYPTGIAFGSNERLLIANGQVFAGYPASAGDVDIYLQGYLTSN